jgi:hypothetical protein
MASSINASTSGPGGVITTADNSGILNLQSGGNTVATVNSAGMTTVGTVNVPNTFGFKNRLINGGMQIWQRGTSFTGSSSIAYYADRWSSVQYAGSLSTISQVSGAGLAGSTYVMQVQRPNAATNTATINMAQSVESQNCVDLAGKTVTFSFWAKAGAGFSAASNILVSQITTGTGTDQNVYGTYTGAVTTSQNNTLTTSWQQFSMSITVPSNATEIAVTLYYTPTGTAGASDYYQLGQAQLELGSQATSFDFRSIGTELALCERYFQKCGMWTGAANTSTNWLGVASVRTSMRTTPSLGATGPLVVSNYYTTDFLESSLSISVLSSDASTMSICFWIFNFSGMTGGAFLGGSRSPSGAGTGNYLQLIAEL